MVEMGVGGGRNGGRRGSEGVEMGSGRGSKGVEMAKIDPPTPKSTPSKGPKMIIFRPFLEVFERVLNSCETSICEVFCRERPHNYISCCPLPLTWAAPSQRGE